MSWSALAAAAMSSLVQRHTNRMNAKAVKKSNRFNAQQAEINRQYQERLSSSAVSRYKEDLISSGFNPLLAGSSGLQASTPGSTPATGGYSQADSPVPAYLEKAAAAAGVDKINAEIEQMTHSTKFIDVQAELADAQRRAQDVNSAIALSRYGYTEPELRTRSNVGSVADDVTSAIKRVSDFIRDNVLNSSAAKSLFNSPEQRIIDLDRARSKVKSYLEGKKK